MNWKLGAFLGVVFLGALAYARHSGVQSAELRLARQYADSVAARGSRIADSVKLSFVRSFDSSAKVTDSVKRAAEIAVNRAARQTNQALEVGKSAVQAAERLLADSSATIGQLRGALQADNKAIDSLSLTITAERQATNDARIARDSSHAREVRLLRGGFDATVAAKDSALAAFRKAMVADLALARGAGLRKGRVEGTVVGALIVGGLVYLVKP